MYCSAAVREGPLSSLCVLAIAAAVALTVGGCGGGGSSGSSSESTATATASGGGKEASPGGKEASGGGKQAGGGSSSLSKEEFIAKAGAICTREKTKGLEEMGEYVKQHPATGKAKLEEIGEALQTVFLPAVQRQVDQIRALGAPAGDEDEVEAILDALEEAVQEAGQGTPSNGSFAKAFASSASLAREYGLAACAYG